MFVAMVMCLPIAWIARLVETHKKKKSSDEQKPLLGKGDGGESCLLHVLYMRLCLSFEPPAMRFQTNIITDEWTAVTYSLLKYHSKAADIMGPFC